MAERGWAQLAGFWNIVNCFRLSVAVQVEAIDQAVGMSAGRADAMYENIRAQAVSIFEEVRWRPRKLASIDGASGVQRPRCSILSTART